MPRGDRTGPEGIGPRSGRGLGYCNGYETPGYMKARPFGGRGLGRGFRRGFSQGFGRGSGYRWRMYQPYDEYYQPPPTPSMNPEEDTTYLKQVIKDLEQELTSLKDRLQELGKKKDSTP